MSDAMSEDKIPEVICEYDPADGSIPHTIDAFPAEMVAYLTSIGATFVVHENPLEEPIDGTTHYVAEGAVVPRPEFDVPDAVTLVADGVDHFVFSGLPNPTTITVNGDEAVYPVEDGAFEFSTDMASTYMLRLEAWPYRPATVEVTAT